MIKFTYRFLTNSRVSKAEMNFEINQQYLKYLKHVGQQQEIDNRKIDHHLICHIDFILSI